ncbi:hypothetical protein ACOSP7_011254 [Xanthoceras sorbifolium]
MSWAWLGLRFSQTFSMRCEENWSINIFSCACVCVIQQRGVKRLKPSLKIKTRVQIL